MVDQDHNITSLRSFDDADPASLPAGTWIVYPTVRDAARKHRLGFNATSRTPPRRCYLPPALPDGRLGRFRS